MEFYQGIGAMMLFWKSQGWENLSEVEKLWAKKLTRKNAAQLLAAAAKDHRQGTAPVRYILDNYSPAAGAVQAAIVAAVGAKAPAILQTLYDYCGKQGAGFYKNWEQSFGLFTATSRARSQECWEIVWAGNEALPENLRMPHKDIAEILVREGFSGGYGDFLEKKTPPGETAVFVAALQEALKQSADMLHCVVWWGYRFPEARPALEAALVGQAAAGNTDKVRVLLESGRVSVNAENSCAFRAAARKGHLEVVEYMVSRGANVELLAPALLPELCGSLGPGNEMLLYLDGFCDGRYRREFGVAEEKRKENERFALVDNDTLAETKKLPAGGSLTILFNFTTRQQMVMAEKKDGTHESLALQVINFADIENTGTVVRAAKKFIQLGGDPKMVEEPRFKRSIFPKQ